MLKVLFTGPESTGKTYLAQAMAQHFNAPWVPEFARTYLGQIERPYQQTDLLEIARGQLQLEAMKAKEARELLICDTGPIVMKIWSQVKYGNCHHWIENQVVQQHYDLYCLCNIDLPWTYDPLREHQSLKARQDLYQRYKKELQILKRPWVEISGNGTVRVHNSVKAIEALLENKGN